MAKDGCMDIFPYQIFGSNQESPYLCNRLSQSIAAIAQLVEHDLAKVGVASSSLVCRSFPKGCPDGGMVDTKDLKSFGQ